MKDELISDVQHSEKTGKYVEETFFYLSVQLNQTRQYIKWRSYHLELGLETYLFFWEYKFFLTR